MQEKMYGRSPYLSANKTKDGSFFPKIHRGEFRANNKYLPRSLAKNNYHQSIFKAKDQTCEKQKPLNLKPVEIDQQRIYQSKQYKDLEAQILEYQKNHKKQLAELEQKKKTLSAKAEDLKKKNFQAKYDFWMLRNQIMGLEATLRNEQDQNERLLYSLGYNTGTEQELGDYGSQLEINEQSQNPE